MYFSLLEIERSAEFDYMIKFYCDILYRWGLYIKRAELFEYIREKPSGWDSQFGNLTKNLIKKIFGFSFEKFKNVQIDVQSAIKKHLVQNVTIVSLLI